MDSTTLIIIILVVLLIGGGGFYGRGRATRHHGSEAARGRSLPCSA
jgi:hypothetical protein